MRSTLVFQGHEKDAEESLGGGERNNCLLLYLFVMGYKCFWMMPIRRQAVRFKLDRAKSKEIERRWGFSLEQAKSIFEHPTYFERRENYPGQFLVIGLLDDLRLVSVVVKPLPSLDGLRPKD